MTARKPRIWDEVIVPFAPAQPGACEGVEEFTMNDAGYSVRRQGALALQADFCASCPILRECIAHSYNHEPYGLRGLTEHQRRDLGGVVASEWADYEANPAQALEEIGTSGIPVELVKEVIQEAGHGVPRQRQRRRKVA